MVHPINYQGIVLAAGQVAVENVASEVQNIPTISTVVATRTGRVVASEVQGARRAGRDLRRALAHPGRAVAATALDDPPGPGGARRDLRGRHLQPGHGHRDGDGGLPAALGPLAPLTDKVLPGTTWTLATRARGGSPTTRPMPPTSTPPGEPASSSARTVSLPAAAATPQAGGAGGRRVDHPVAGGPVGGALARHGRQPRRERRRSGLPRAGQHLGEHRQSSAFATSAQGTHVLATGTLAPGTVTDVSGSIAVGPGSTRSWCTPRDRWRSVRTSARPGGSAW